MAVCWKRFRRRRKNAGWSLFAPKFIDAVPDKLHVVWMRGNVARMRGTLSREHRFDVGKCEQLTKIGWHFMARTNRPEQPIQHPVTGFFLKM